MRKPVTLLCRAGWVVLLTGVFGASQLHAQTPSASSNLVAQPIPDRVVPYSLADPGVAKPISWGMDAGGWTSPVIWQTGVNYLGASTITITRIPAFPTDVLYGDTLQKRQKDLVKERLDQAALAGHALQIMLNPGGGEIAWYSRDAAGYARYALLMELTKKYIESFGHTVVSITGYNEPDPGYAGVSKQNFYDFIAACKARPGLRNLRFCGGNTLNNDLALDWYNYVRPAGLNEGNTHQLAGVFDTYANFYQTVRANGDYATNDEVHDIMEGIVGAQYGMQAGIYWGYANLARGEFSKASYTGKRLGYAEHRPNWTAAAVYRQATGQVQAFGGASERQAATTTYSYVAKDRDVYYEGYGPQREYSLLMPGGSGYMTNDQPYAERVINISWGEDVQPAVRGRYVVVNRGSGKVLEIPGGATANGTALQQNTYGGASYQQWSVRPISARSGGDFSYFTLVNAGTGKAADLLGYSLDNGGTIVAYDSANTGNQQYYFDYAGDGYFYIRNRHSTKCLGVLGSSTAAGGSVVQWDKNGNFDQQWRLLPVGAAVEFTAPSAPAGLVATAGAESVRLSWTASPEADVAGYNVYRAEAAGGPFNTIARNVPGTAFIDNTATLSGQYFYKLKAVDKSLNRSAYSNQATATTTGARDLVAQLRFDGSLLDNSSNGNHAAAYGGPTFAAGKVGTGSLTLNGSTFVQLPATLANQPEITVAAWVYWNGGGAWQRIFDFGNDQSQYLFLTPNNGAGSLRFGIRNGGTEQTLDAPALAANAWTHVAVTLGANGARLFVNGQKVAESTAITIRPLDFKPVLNYLGRSQYPDALFSGRLDEVRVYNYALAPVEVATLAAPGTYYQVQNRTTSLYLDGMGRTANGDNCGQYANTTHPNAFWALREVGSGYYQLQNQGTGLYLDGMGRTANGDNCGQFAGSGSPNQHWAVEQYDGDYYRLRNRTTSLYLDGMGRTANGVDASQWANTTNTNAQWNFRYPAPAAARIATTLAAPSAAEVTTPAVYPNPVGEVLHVRLPQASTAAQARLLNATGQLVRTLPLPGPDTQLPVADLPTGLYFVELATPTETTRLRFVKQ